MHTIRLALLTWNVGGAPAGIAPGTTTLLRCAANADVIIVGLQEVSVGRRGWKAHLAKALGDRWRYVGGESLAGLRLKAFARVREGKACASVAAAGMKVGAGFAARWPNKGAVAVEMRFAPTCRVLFVVAHLAANEDQLAERADDWRAILRRLDRDSGRIAGMNEPVIPLFHRYDHVFVLGDLNYRIEAPGTDCAKRVEWVQERVDARDWRALLAADQLTRERQACRVFANFQEAPVNFAPTFKIDPRTGRYSKARVPSYCDRILWHSLPARVDLVVNRRYEPLPEFRQSDHVPVVAEFDLSVPYVSNPRRSTVLPKGLRPVLEFKLVRFVKGKPSAQLLERQRLKDCPSSLRRLSNAPTLPMVAIGDLHTMETVVSSAPGFSSSFDDEGGNEGDDDDDDDDGDDDDDIDGIGQDVEGGLRARIRDEFEDDTLDDDDGDVSTASTDSRDTDRDEHYSNNFEDGSDLYSPYEGAEEVGTTRHRPAAPLRAAMRRPKARVADRSSGEMSSAFDEELLADMLTRMSASASSSTENTSPAETPKSRGADGTFSTSGGSGVSDGTSGGLSSSPEPGRRNQYDGDSSRLSLRPHDVCDDPQGQASRAPLKRDSLSRQIGERHEHGKKRRRARLNELHMEVHGHGLFLKRDRVYRVSVPKRRNGARERIGESLPAIPLAPVASLEELAYRHVVLMFTKMNSKVGTSGALPLRELLEHQGKPYAFEMIVTKYGQPIGTVEACVQLTVREAGCWVDARGRVVRNFNGSSNKGYRGSLQVRRRTRARTKPDQSTRR